MVVVLSILLLLLNCLGCAGACLLSYSLLSGTEVFNHCDNIYSSASGFTMFMFVSFILYACLALWIFANNMEDSVMDSFVTEKISQYSKSEGIFNMVIDTVQRDLQCCGFKSSADWAGSFPSSCCLDSCAGEECLEVEQECVLENIHTSSCLEMIRYTRPLLHCGVLTVLLLRSNLLQPDSMVGLIGKIRWGGFGSHHHLQE